MGVGKAHHSLYIVYCTLYILTGAACSLIIIYHKKGIISVMKTVLLSSLYKVFKDVEPNVTPLFSSSCLKNENFSFQLGFCPESGKENEFNIRICSELKDKIKVYLVKNIPSERTGNPDSDSFHYDLKRTEFPDLLSPVIEGEKISVPSGEYHSLWFEITLDGEFTGEKEIEIALYGNDFEKKERFSLNIIDKNLPQQEILYTNWFHNDCLLTHYGINVFSDEYWRIAENYIKNAVFHGMNMILTPVFTPPLDTAVGAVRPTVQLVGVTKNGDEYSFDFSNFEKYIDICLKAGIKAFEISHFFTQWGAKNAPKILATVNGKEMKIFGWETDAKGEEYKTFMKSFGKAFTEEVEKLNIKEKCWLHVSDEPSLEQIEDYKAAAEILHSSFSGFNTFDALSDIDFYREGLIKTPIPCEEHADIFKAEVENFWTYHCCVQVSGFVPNRMFSMPSLRNRVLGVLLYKYNAKGFLQWGHNFWYSQYSKYPIDPFKITAADGAFPSGDAFVVYPAENGEPLNSLRHKVFLEAMQDLRALNLLETLKGRDYVLKLIEKDLSLPLSFNVYPHEDSWLLNLRAAINQELGDF